jgi:hypothetical protein
MSAKTYDRKTAAFAGYVIQNIPALLDERTMDQWMDNPSAMKRFLAGLVSGETKKLLKFLWSVSLPAVATFVASDKFREGKTVDGVKVAWLGQNFKTHFSKKVEKNVPALEAREHELVTGSKDPAIITEFGGEGKVETTLAHFWEFLKVNRSGWHVRYIRDVDGVLWAVDGSWLGGGLSVEAYSLDGPLGWGADGRFLSR